MFLVTRPQPKAEQTARALIAQGFAAIALPAIDVQALEPSLGIPLISYDVVVVTSSYTEPFLQRNLNAMIHQRTQFICVGQSSANIVRDCLRADGLTNQIEIAEPQNSEGIIASQTFAKLSQKSVALIKGQDGRDTIAAYLAQNNVKTDIYETYKRSATFSTTSMNEFDGQSIKCMIVTSVDIAEQIFEHFSLDWLKSIIFMVASQRIYDYVHAKGAQQLVLSDGASTASIVSCANQLHLSGVLDDKR